MFRFTLRAFPWLVPPGYLAILLFIQPADHLGTPENLPHVRRLLHDDYDVAAFALRGLNLACGNIPGAPHPPPIPGGAFAVRVELPIESDRRFFLEYPPPALFLFGIGWLGQGASEQSIPTAVLEGWHNNIVEHWPRNDRDRELWRGFRRAIRIHLILMTGCLLGLMAVVAIGYKPGGGLSGPVAFLILPAVLYFSLNRFDVLPALLVALSLACLGRGKMAASGGLLAGATALKLYPVLIAPLIVRYLMGDRRSCLVWTLTYIGVNVLFLVPPFLLWGIDATLAPYRFQLTRPPEFGWTFFGEIFPECLAEPTGIGTAFRLGSVGLAGLLAMVRMPDNLGSLLRRGAIVLVVFAAVQVFYSPQWIVWMAPLLVPLARQQPRLGWTAGTFDLATYASFPLVADLSDWPGQDLARHLLIIARFVLLAGLVLLLWLGGRSPDPSLAPDSPVE